MAIKTYENFTGKYEYIVYEPSGVLIRVDSGIIDMIFVKLDNDDETTFPIEWDYDLNMYIGRDSDKTIIEDRIRSAGGWMITDL